MRHTRRTNQVLDVLRSTPGLNNREISRQIGGVDQGQLSKLMRRIEADGLVTNKPRAGERGSPCSWSLTRRGKRASQAAPRV